MTLGAPRKHCRRKTRCRGRNLQSKVRSPTFLQESFRRSATFLCPALLSQARSAPDAGAEKTLAGRHTLSAPESRAQGYTLPANHREGRGGILLPREQQRARRAFSLYVSFRLNTVFRVWLHVTSAPPLSPLLKRVQEGQSIFCPEKREVPGIQALLVANSLPLLLVLLLLCVCWS